MPIVYSPRPRRARHRCRPPVVGDGLNSATPTAPIGSIWQCPEEGCGHFFRACSFYPILPGWARVPAWWVKKKVW